MADSPILPDAKAWRLTTPPRGGAPDLPVEFFRFFRSLLSYVERTDSNSALIDEILERLAALESELGGEIDGQMSITAMQQGADTILRLVGDVLYPVAKSYYGTDESGARGWYQRLLATLADVDFSTPPAVDDVLKFDGANWVPGQAAAAQIFNYITTDGEPYCTEDYADLYVGVL